LLKILPQVKAKCYLPLGLLVAAIIVTEMAMVLGYKTPSEVHFV
jgi:hypothetical protein